MYVHKITFATANRKPFNAEPIVAIKRNSIECQYVIPRTSASLLHYNPHSLHHLALYSSPYPTLCVCMFDSRCSRQSITSNETWTRQKSQRTSAPSTKDPDWGSTASLGTSAPAATFWTALARLHVSVCLYVRWKDVIYCGSIFSCT